MPIGAGSRLACSVVLLAIGIAARSVGAAPPERTYGGPQEVAADPDAIEPEPAPPPEEEPAVPEPVPKPDPNSIVGEPIEPTPPTSVVHVRPGAMPASTTIFPSPWLKRHRFIYRNFLAGRFNPIGGLDEVTFAYRLQLVMRNTRLFSDSFLLAGAHLYSTPAFARVGPTIELQPLAMLNLSATYDFVGAYGSFSHVQSFPSASSKWGPDEVLRDIRDRRTYASTGQLVTLSGVFQFLVGKVAIRNQVRAFWAQMKLRRGDRVFYDAATDMLMPNKGWTIVHDADAMYLFDSGLRLAVRHTLTHAFYDQSDFRPGEPVSQPNGPTLRVGPAVAYRFFDRPGVRFNNPTIFVLSQWWYRHRFRTGDERHPAIPYFAIGFSFEGDLFPFRKDTERRRRRKR
jgi:hypothetical protein